MLPAPRVRFSKKNQHRCVLPSSSVMCLQPGSLAMAGRVSVLCRKPWPPKKYLYISKGVFSASPSVAQEMLPSSSHPWLSEALRAGASTGFTSPARPGKSCCWESPDCTSITSWGGDGDGDEVISTSRRDLPCFAGMPMCECAHKAAAPPQCGSSALVLGKNSSLTPVSSLQSLDQQHISELQRFPV